MSLESCVNPTYLIASKETREKIAKSIKEGVDYTVKHPEMLGTGNPKVYEEGLKVMEKSIEKATHKVIDFFKDTIKFANEHPEMLLASASPKTSLFND